MILLTNFFEVMGVVFTALLAIVFGFILYGFFKVRNEMQKDKPVSPRKPLHKR